jgi:hypothetical protein
MNREEDLIFEKLHAFLNHASDPGFSNDRQSAIYF